jgi:hypothetical protein
MWLRVLEVNVIPIIVAQTTVGRCRRPLMLIETLHIYLGLADDTCKAYPDRVHPSPSLLIPASTCSFSPVQPSIEWSVASIRRSMSCGTAGTPPKWAVQTSKVSNPKSYLLRSYYISSQLLRMFYTGSPSQSLKKFGEYFVEELKEGLRSGSSKKK